MDWFYLLFNCCILAGPLLGSWLWLPAFWRHKRALLVAWASVSAAWIGLDVWSVHQGWWDYNPAYILGPKAAGLPLEEIAFFFVVPFACMVAFAGLQRFVQGRVALRAARVSLIGIGVLAIGLLVGAFDRSRTVVDCVLLLLTVVLLWYSPLIGLRAYWCWNALILVLCLTFNTILTSLPVVIYDEQFMTGWRLGTIPLEDFLYNFSLLNLFLIVMYRRSAMRPPAVDQSAGQA